MDLAIPHEDRLLEAREPAPAPRVGDADRPPPPSATATSVTLAWLVRLRWGGVIGQAATIAVATAGLGLDLRLGPLSALVATTLVTNVALAAWTRRTPDVPTSTTGFVLVVDTLILSGLLSFAGGPSNPFSVFYLVHVTIAALILGMRWAGAIVGLSAALYAALFAWHSAVPGMDHAHHGGAAFSAHLQGMWIAFTLAASLIAFFVARVAAALRERDADLALARQRIARSEALASLTTLAAGAAHELGTPLGTIAIASKELEWSIRLAPSEAIVDARLIRTEVDRCRAIVHRMSAQAGSTAGEVPESTRVDLLLGRCRDRLGRDVAERVVVEAGEPVAIECPAEGLVQVLLSLVQNGLQATAHHGRSGVGAGRVTLACVGTPSHVRFVVEDDGVGIPAAVLARVGEPFFTTKPPGEGMGLGVFLARTFAERCDGRFELTSREGEGTRATLVLPRRAGGAS